MSERWEQVNALFHAALERPSEERAAFVAAEAKGDDGLAREVLSLISAHQAAGSFLQAPVGRLPLAPGRRVLSAGTVVGNYRIERELGRGGMGVVYLAEDQRLSRRVALKMLAPGFAGDPQRRERLRKEARAAARLSHPGIAAVYSLEEIGDELFMVCEYVPGRMLRDELGAGQVPVERVVAIGAEVARALAAAHTEGVVHRDIKPENIVCSKQGGVKILDFGVARTLPLGSRSDHRITEPGTIVGTQAYMSPEQIEGGTVDARSDIFSFGILLYELATGIHPFEGSSPASTIARILAVEPKPPRDLRRQLPPDFDRIVSKCLEKRAENRYQSTLDLALDLERLGPRPGTGGSRERTAGPAPVTRETRWWRVHQAAVVGVYTAMATVAWIASRLAHGDWPAVAFFVAVAAGALNGTLRVHLLFTERHNRAAFRGELRRATPWLRVSDAAFGVVLMALAIPLASSYTAVAVVLSAFGAGSIIVSLAVEPATTMAAFPKRASGVGRKSS